MKNNLSTEFGAKIASFSEELIKKLNNNYRNHQKKSNSLNNRWKNYLVIQRDIQRLKMCQDLHMHFIVKKFIFYSKLIYFS